MQKQVNIFTSTYGQGPPLPFGQPDQKINVVYDFPLGDVDILVPQLCTDFLNDGP